MAEGNTTLIDGILSLPDTSTKAETIDVYAPNATSAETIAKVLRCGGNKSYIKSSFVEEHPDAAVDQGNGTVKLMWLIHMPPPPFATSASMTINTAEWVFRRHECIVITEEEAASLQVDMILSRDSFDQVNIDGSQG